MDEEDFQVSGQALGLGWGWAAGGSFPSVGLDRQKVPSRCLAGKGKGEGVLRRGCLSQLAAVLGPSTLQYERVLVPERLLRTCWAGLGDLIQSLTAICSLPATC